MSRGWGAFGGGVAFTVAVACGKSESADDGPGLRKATSVSVSASASAATPSACVSPKGASSAPRFDEDDETANVRVGAVFEIELRSPRNPGYKYAWLPAELDHPGIDALGKQILEPDKSVDGGSYRHLYRFRPMKTGTFIITIANTSAKSQDEVPSYTLRVRVEP